VEQLIHIDVLLPCRVLQMSQSSPSFTSMLQCRNSENLQSLPVDLILQTIDRFRCSLLHFLKKFNILYHIWRPCLDTVFHVRSEVCLVQDPEVLNINLLEVPFYYSQYIQQMTSILTQAASVFGLLMCTDFLFSSFFPLTVR